jgi:hypothetical protein
MIIVNANIIVINVKMMKIIDVIMKKISRSINTKTIYDIKID